MGMWPQFRSPLVWDVFAVSTYATVSLLFWYIGLIPDLATLRDRAKTKFAQIVYGDPLALGWRGSARHWHRYRSAYLLMAGLATPLVVSVHTVVSFDFTIGIVPGWHSTIFPPYFVAGAIFSGFAMVLTLTIPLRKAYGLEDFITDAAPGKHGEDHPGDRDARGLSATSSKRSWPGTAATLMRSSISSSGSARTGRTTHTYRMLIFCNCITPQLLWIPWFRRNPIALWIISMIVNIGMWLERYVIVVDQPARRFHARRPGICTTGRSGTTRPSTARSGCSSRCSSCSCGSCR